MKLDRLKWDREAVWMRIAFYVCGAIGLPACTIHGWLEFELDRAPRTPVFDNRQVYAGHVSGKGFHFIAYTTSAPSTLWSSSTILMLIVVGVVMMLGIFAMGKRQVQKWNEDDRLATSPH